jgi:hypothetical protein
VIIFVFAQRSLFFFADRKRCVVPEDIAFLRVSVARMIRSFLTFITTDVAQTEGPQNNKTKNMLTRFLILSPIANGASGQQE